MTILRRFWAAAALGLFLMGTPAWSKPLPKVVQSTESPSQKANALFDDAFQELLERTPMDLSRTGSRKFYDRWNDLSTTERRARHQLLQLWVEKIQAQVDPNILDEETKLSLTLFLYNAQREADSLEFLEYDYPVNQMHGIHSEVPAFLFNVHQIENRWEAECYINRLHRIPALFEQLSDGLKRREAKGIMPPIFVYDYVLSDIDNLLKGYPLDDSAEPNVVYADFSKKVKALKLSAEQEAELLERGRQGVKQGFEPGYRALKETLTDQRTRADTRDGVWKFPNGSEYYSQRLKHVTTTNLGAEEIHRLGLSEVERIHGEMRQIMKSVGFQGTLQEFFQVMRTDKRFLHPNTDKGKAEYLVAAVKTVDDMKAKLDDLFLTKPKAELVVKAVEPFREQTAGKAFYETPALDGSRPGIYYANLYDMGAMPTYQMEALAYHEAIPGHHMQLSIAQELESLPRFRRLGSYTAYIEGWGLYSERLPKEYGFYQDPYSDFGRLAMELWRACRLVVDTGIHHKRWTREQGVDFYRQNTPNALSDCQKMVDRHIVMPGQATAYKIGMNEILRLRAKAKEQLGQDFDIREFHDVVLTHGAVPLAVLEQLVDSYIAKKRAG